MYRTQGHLSQALRDVHNSRLSFLAGLSGDLPTQRTTGTDGLSTERAGTTELLLTDRTAITVVQRGDPAVVDCQLTERSMTSVDQYLPVVSTKELQPERLGTSLPQHASRGSCDSEIRQSVELHLQQTGSGQRSVDRNTASRGETVTLSPTDAGNAPAGVVS